MVGGMPRSHCIAELYTRVRGIHEYVEKSSIRTGQKGVVIPPKLGNRHREPRMISVGGVLVSC